MHVLDGVGDACLMLSLFRCDWPDSDVTEMFESRFSLIYHLSSCGSVAVDQVAAAGPGTAQHLTFEDRCSALPAAFVPPKPQGLIPSACCSVDRFAFVITSSHCRWQCHVLVRAAVCFVTAAFVSKPMVCSRRYYHGMIGREASEKLLRGSDSFYMLFLP